MLIKAMYLNEQLSQFQKQHKEGSIFSTQTECSFTSSLLKPSVVLHLLHSFRVDFSKNECTFFRGSQATDNPNQESELKFLALEILSTLMSSFVDFCSLKKVKIEKDRSLRCNTTVSFHQTLLNGAVAPFILTQYIPTYLRFYYLRKYQ